MKKLTLLLTTLIFISCSKIESAPNLFAFSDNIINNGKYNAFGITFLMKNNVIGIAYREGTNHVGTKGVIKLRTSKTNFVSSQTVYQDSFDCRNGGGGVTSSGRVIIFFSRYDTVKSAFKDMGYVYSDDNCNTFSGYNVISHKNCDAFTFYGPLVISDKETIEQSWYGNTGNNYQVYLIKSYDNGTSWGPAVQIAQSMYTHFTETSIAYLGERKLIALSRAENQNFFIQSLSQDNGNTWTNGDLILVDTILFQKSPPWLRTFNQNGRMKIACYYANRTTNIVRAMYADADSLVWRTRTDLAVMQAGGYPSAIQPYNDSHFFGWYYNEINPHTANINFMENKNQPK